jgi:hypothetical protein
VKTRKIPKRTLLFITVLLTVPGAIPVALILPGIHIFGGSGRFRMHTMEPGEIMPEPDTEMNGSMPPSPLPPVGLQLLDIVTAQVRPEEATERTFSPKNFLAWLASGKDTERINALLRERRPHAGVGSSWLLRKGDYDFSLAAWTTLLYLFGDQPERLYPETKAHLLDVLLTESGGKPKTTVPGTCRLITETENHILLAESSRYLKNQWLHLNGTEAEQADPRWDNARNGLESWLLGFLEAVLTEGIYEFNSRPYSGYTIHALLNLEGFAASPAVRQKARLILDRQNLTYALGSLQLRRFPPFRRQYRRADTQELDSDPHTAFFYAWTGVEPDDPRVIPWARNYSDWSLIASLLPYRLPEALRQWALEKKEPYFVRFSHGASGCPEIYSAGPGWLLTAGGFNRGLRSLVVAMPITLMLEDGQRYLDGCIHLNGAGKRRSWNATGVYTDFACIRGTAHVPEGWTPEAAAGGWRIFRAPITQPLVIALYENQDQVCLLALFHEADLSADALLARIQEANPEEAALSGRFARPGGTTLEYDLDAKAGCWVMKEENGTPFDRNCDRWEQIGGTAPHLSFRR